MEVLNNIIQSIRDGDFSKFFQLIDNTNKPQINKSLGGNKIKSKSKKTKKMYKKNQNSIKNRSKKRRNSAKIRSKKNGIRLKYSLKSPSKH
tara:strand:+ start:124 stop:396 length:273 start_codon:yes stop_codon:yes gene_type:complete